MQHIRIYYSAETCVNSGVVASSPGIVPAQEGRKGVQRASITEAQRYSARQPKSTNWLAQEPEILRINGFQI